MAAIAGVNTMVTIGPGANKIIGLGTWRFEGVTTDMIEVSSICPGDGWKTYLCGLKDGGAVSFDGYYDSGQVWGATGPDSVKGGQFKLIDYNLRCACINSIRFYLSCSPLGSYWRPNFVGIAGSGMSKSCIRIESIEVGADKGGLVSISFTGKIEGNMRFH